VFSNGSSQDVTATCTNWQSANAGVLTVTSTGMLTARADGSSAITTTCQGIAARAVMTIVLKSASPSTFTLSGTISDGFSGGTLPNVYIQVTGGANHGRYTRSDAAGNYRLDGLSAGTFTLTISAVTYVTTNESMTLSADTRLDVVLPRAPRVGPSDGTYSYRLVLSVPSACQGLSSTSYDFDSVLVVQGDDLSFNAGHPTTQVPLTIELTRTDSTLAGTSRGESWPLSTGIAAWGVLAGSIDASGRMSGLLDGEIGEDTLSLRWHSCTSVAIPWTLTPR
jgi:hypothetical protein